MLLRRLGRWASFAGEFDVASVLFCAVASACRDSLVPSGEPHPRPHRFPLRRQPSPPGESGMLLGDCPPPPDPSGARDPRARAAVSDADEL